MKYETKVVINAPIDEVIKKLDNPDNMKHWQKGLLSYKMLNTLDPNTPGAKMELHYKLGKREMTMTETILKNNFPHEFEASYQADGIYTIQKSIFKAISSNKTSWVCYSDFRFKSLMMKAVGFVLPGLFKQQSKQFLGDFKNFVEKGTSVANES